MVTTVEPKVNQAYREDGIRTIVVAEDAGDLADSIRYNLEHQGYRVLVANDRQSSLELALVNTPSLVLLDINLTGVSAVDLCRQFRNDPATTRVPILMLTARAGDSDQVLGLDLGVDDYLTKPFRMRELLARVNALLRRNDGLDPSPAYDDGVLVIDPWSFRVTYEGREIRLTRKEMRLLDELARNEGRVMMRDVLLDRIWGLRNYGDSRTLDVHIRRLRTKLGNPRLIETITGVGYRLIGSRSKSE
jgi:two-component system, OmpR family, alkaline phosphatase synthesis response regulator PhoP